MKQLLLFSLLALSRLSICAQHDTIWYNSKWEVCKKQEASFYRPQPFSTDSGYWVRDYYLSGKLQYECLSQDLTTEDWVNTATWYKENGNISGTREFRKIIANGALQTYYPDGGLKTKTNFNNWHRNGTAYTYYNNGKTAAVIPWKNNMLNGEYVSYYKDGAEKNKGSFINNLSDGTYQLFYPGRKLKKQMQFTNGVLRGDMFELTDEGDTTVHFIFNNNTPSGYNFFKRGLRDTMLYVTLKNGMPDGRYINKFFDNPGSLFNNGKLVHWNIIRERSNIKIVSGKQINDSTDEWEYFYDDTGMPLAKGRALYNQPYGTWNIYTETGTPVASYSLLPAPISNTPHQFFSIDDWGYINMPATYHQYYNADRLKNELLFSKTFSSDVTIYNDKGMITGKGKIINGLPSGKWTIAQQNGKSQTIDFNTGNSARRLASLVTISYDPVYNEKRTEISDLSLPPLNVLIYKHSKEYYSVAAGTLVKDLCLKNPGLVMALMQKAKKITRNSDDESIEMNLRYKLDPSSEPLIKEARDEEEEELALSVPVLLQ